MFDTPTKSHIFKFTSFVHALIKVLCSKLHGDKCTSILEIRNLSKKYMHCSVYNKRCKERQGTDGAHSMEPLKAFATSVFSLVS